ncbi:MAG: flagellar filament outer layer protein FlaA [Spirochaetaceae bacterium]|nr:flagellar filament outer layer protein FlaA [Spirochaetaceae bacterium]
MKKNFILSVLACLLVGSLAFAEEAVIIDFSQLSADIIDDGNGVMAQNRRTTVYYGQNAGMTFTEGQKALMRSSLTFKNWTVVLNSSARRTESLANSQVMPAKVKDGATVPFAGKEILGVRVYFPKSNSNASARIVPPFNIPVFQTKTQIGDDGVDNGPSDEDKASSTYRFEEGFGVVMNVGTIKSITVTTLGMNFPHGLYVILSNEDGEERRYFMGYLNFDGWKELTWNNATYITDVRARELRTYPIYPQARPHVRFVALEITRNGADIAEDFIGYFKDVKIVYDKAVLESERDIVDEDIWGIVSARETERQNSEMTKFGDRQLQLFIEREKMATETGTTSSLVPPESGAAE